MSIQDYLDFELNVEALDATKLRITVASSPVGSVSFDTTNPFTADELTRVIGLLEGSIHATRSVLNQEIRAFGEKLFSTIFSGQVYAAYLASLERAGAAGLRIRLGLEEAGPLATIPWELLRDPHTDYLALSRQTPVIRYPRVLTVRPLVEVRLPLRVLVLISSPGDQDKIDVEGEWRALQEATTELRNRGLLELERVDDAQLVTLQGKLREGTEYQVFHFIGHAAFDERSQTGMLAFDNPQTNTSVPVSGEALARELSEENSIRLVVLNACQAARQNINDPFAGISSSIVARGVPSVVAMQFSIADSASRLFSQAFYQALSEGYSIEAAMAEARRTISGSLGNFEWATPVLYLRTPTGILFPRRKSKDARMSTGGVRELIQSPRGIGYVVAALLVILLAGFGITTAFRRSIVPGGTPGPTAITGPRDVDLDLKSLRFSPPNPVPGQHVTVAMVISNDGTTDSGPFRWGWWVDDPQVDKTPTISFPVANLGPGESLNVKGDFYFGLWGTYITTAWVNYDNAVPETNILNNWKQRAAITSNDPMVVDFTVLPDGNAIVNPQALKGDEFSKWGFHIAPDTGTQADCKSAAVEVDVQDNGNRLITGVPGQNGTCTNLPIVFTLDQAIGGSSVTFQAITPGRYALDLFDENDKKIGTANADADATQPILTIRAPATGSLPNVRKVRFAGPDKGVVAVQGVSFSLPSQSTP